MDDTEEIIGSEENDSDQINDLLDDSSSSVNLDSISNIPVEMSAVLGTCKIEVSQLLKLGRGAVVTLDRKVGEPIDILVNNRLVAKGEVIIVENKIGVTLTEIIKS